MENRSIKVKESETESFSARIATFERESDRVAVLFWYEMDNAILKHSSGIRAAMQRARMKNSPLPVIFKSMLQTPNDERAEERLRTLASEVRAQMRLLRGINE